MAKAKKQRTVFLCTDCGADTPRWLGKCPSCGAWNTLVEERVRPAPKGATVGARAIAPASPATPLTEVAPEGAARRSTTIAELDRVLGGGAVLGSAVLLGGDPGIGKSTLLMQALAGLSTKDATGLYVSGEESASQIALRAQRLTVGAGDPGEDPPVAPAAGRARPSSGRSSKMPEHLLVTSERSSDPSRSPELGSAIHRGLFDHVLVQATTELEAVEDTLHRQRPTTVIIDSIQTIRSGGLESVAGSVGQIREVASRLIEVAKRQGITLFLIGHVTKEGMLAGPKVLEHLVDTVLSFEGDSSGAFRMVRTTKNRFGPAHEVGVFEMMQDGLREVPDPSALFLAERPDRAAGSVVIPTAEGSRPLLVEVQALVAPAVYGSSRRVSSGIDSSRLAILLAVLDRKADVHVLDHDVFASIAGGARVDERAVDLPLALAIVSSFRDRALPPELVAFGEVGLAGEVRAVPRAGLRLQEAKKLGFTKAILPKGNLERLNGDAPSGMELVGVASLADALSETLR